MLPMSDEGSFLFPGSLKPPILQAPVANSSGRRPGSPAWVILDTAAYIADRRNGTYAEATTRTGQTVGVSFWLADPPAVSHLCIHCPGMKVTDFLDEPLVVCSGKDIAVIRVAYTFGARPIESMEDMGATDFDYFVYRAHANNPSLELLPNPKPLFFEPREIGFLPSVDGEDFLIAVLHPRRVSLKHDLHIFSSKKNEWTTKLVLLEPPSPGYKDKQLVHRTDKVITLEGGTLGWVDLWRGILLCNVLDREPVLHYIQCPKPLDGNMTKHLNGPARAVRDVTCTNGFIRLIEIEKQSIPGAPDMPSIDPRNEAASLELENTTATCTTESYVLDGWAAVTWTRKAASDCWSKGCKAYVSGSSILPALRHNHPSLALEDLVVAGPVWSVHGDDAFYLMAKARSKNTNAWAISVNMRDNLLDGVAYFSEGRDFFFKLAYRPFALSKYLDVTPDHCKAGSQMPEREDSRNDPNNAVVLMEGLDPCVSQNQLKGILAMFGELRNMEFHVKGQYGLVQFVHRSCAEDAIRTLNGAQIGRKGICLSWSRSNLSKEPPKRRFSERNSTNYHPYARLYVVFASTHCGTGGSITPRQHQRCQPPAMANYSTNYHPYARLYGVHSNKNIASTHCGTGGSIPPLQHQGCQPPALANYSTHQE